MPDFTVAVLRLVRLYGPLFVAVFTFLESSMLFPFLPSEVVVPAAAAVVVGDVPSFVAFVTAGSVGGTVGAFVPFLAFRGRGSRWVQRLLAYVHVSDEAIERSRRWFLTWGVTSVLWGRFLPGLRSVVSVPAGLAGMAPTWFGVFTALGTLGFYATVAAVVFVARRRSVYATVRAAAAERPAVSVAVLLAAGAAVALVTVWHRRRADLPDGT